MKKGAVYEQIYPLCKVKNLGSFYHNSKHRPPPRVIFILELLQKIGISYSLDLFETPQGNIGYNVILPGRDSTRMVVAHHDIVNPESDNANDNSASVINAIALKLCAPEIWVAILDGEEVGGLGSERISKKIVDGKFGKIDWVLNLELTGKGGDTFFIGNYPGKLTDSIQEKFSCPIVETPFNDSVIFRRNGIDSCVINSLPILAAGESKVKWKDSYLDFSLLGNCHTLKDSVETIDPLEMEKFVEGVLVEIVKG